MLGHKSLAAVMLSSALCLTGAAAAGAASLQEDVEEDGSVVVIDGVEYGPEDGLEVDVTQYEIEPGSGTVGETFGEPTGEIGPMATWGSSYAISTETAQLRYNGKAKAGGNVYSGKRIIKVCFWYSRGGDPVSSTYCSTASSAGSGWQPGSEVTHGVWDSLNPWAPVTIFNIRTTRINPDIN